jgi:predicted TIM-barrel fold metal-dependent hydrolase
MAPATTDGKRRFVDCHFHIWDANTHPAWYDFPDHDSAVGRKMGWKMPLPKVWTLRNHCEALDCVKLTKAVHVTAVGHPTWAVAETTWLEEAERTRLPVAMIGTVDLEETLKSIAQRLDECMSTRLFRGIRVVQPIDYNSERGMGVLRLLSERDLVYNAVSYLDGGITSITQAAARLPALKVVLEHTGWPSDQNTDPTKFGAWKDEIREFAELDRSFVKLSGLGMVYHRTSARDFLPHFEYCLSQLGAARCMFGSNFPVDAMYGTFSDLYDVFEAAVVPLSPEEQADAFGKTAERVYRI